MKEKVYILLKSFYLIAKYLFVFTKLFFIKLRIKVIRNNWYISKNRNYYNPRLSATVYRYGSMWKIARYNDFFGNFKNKNDAMASIFQEWLEENKILDTITSLQNTLKNIKQEIFGNSENSKNDQGKIKEPINENYRILEKSENNINFISKYFYLGQATKNCYKCQKNILVNAIVLPENFETIDHKTIDELEQQGIHVEDFSLFRSQDYQSILSYLTYISPKALEKIYNHVDRQLFKKEYSFSTNHKYYRSICNYCGSAQGDNYVISEHNSAFNPVSIEDFKKIKFYKIDEEIKLLAGSNSIDYGYSSNSFSATNIYKT